MRQVQSLLRAQAGAEPIPLSRRGLRPPVLGHSRQEGLRKPLSTIERTDEGKTQASGHSLKIETDKEGRRTIYLDLPTDPDFDMLEFRRALYRIALSTVAMLEGADYALDPKFDEASR